MNYKLFVGIDQSKGTIDVAILDAQQPEAFLYEQFPNTKKGFQAMLRKVVALGYPLDQTLFCSENTGMYSLPLSIFFEEQKAHFWLENALQIHLSSGLKRGKNDKADAKDIARYCFIHQHEVRLYKMPSRSILVLRNLLSFRERLIKNKMAMQVPSRELQEMGADLGGMVFNESKAIIKLVDKKIEAVDQRMMGLINENEQLKKLFTLITSVHGVGPQTALYVLIYTNAFTLFSEWKKFACYCGIAPFEYSSGTSIRGKTRVSRLGNRRLKALLTMCAINTIKGDNEFKTYYDRRTLMGKNPMSTINIIRNKLVSRIFAVVKRGTAYQKQYVPLESEIVV
jgi:transposase